MELVVETELEAARTGLGPGFVELETTDREVVVVVCWMRWSMLEDKKLKELESVGEVGDGVGGAV